jgi:hypothetical protein
MINLIGKWNIVEIIQFNEKEGCMDWVKAEDYLAQDDLDREMAAMLKYQVLFEENGNFGFLMPIPEDLSQKEIDEALASGEFELKDGMILVDKHHWKVENGKNMADIGHEGEVMGEKVGPWEELKEVDAETIEMMIYRLRKTE